jgi:hypothetical protein
MASRPKGKVVKSATKEKEPRASSAKKDADKVAASSGAFTVAIESAES